MAHKLGYNPDAEPAVASLLGTAVVSGASSKDIAGRKAALKAEVTDEAAAGSQPAAPHHAAVEPDECKEATALPPGTDEEVTPLRAAMEELVAALAGLDRVDADGEPDETADTRADHEAVVAAHRAAAQSRTGGTARQGVLAVQLVRDALKAGLGPSEAVALPSDLAEWIQGWDYAATDFESPECTFIGNYVVYSRQDMLDTIKEFQDNDFPTRHRNDPGRYTPQELDRSEQKIKFVWWSPLWVPIAQDSGGNMLCVDLDPDINGVRGQVIGWERAMGPVGPKSSSLLEFVRQEAAELRADMVWSAEDRATEERTMFT